MNDMTPPNEYLSDCRWDMLQAAIADALLSFASDVNDPDSRDRARDRAALLLADTGVMFEQTRVEMGDAHKQRDGIEIHLNGLTARIDLEAPEAMAEPALRMSMQQAVEAYLSKLHEGQADAA